MPLDSLPERFDVRASVFPLALLHAFAEQPDHFFPPA